MVWGTALLMTISTSAQLEVPTRIILNGSASMDRQVTGLALPTTPTDGVSLAATRTNATTTTTVTGANALLGTLTPAPTAYTPGMIITIIPSQINTDAATLELNGLGPHFIVNENEQPLHAGVLRPGIPARVVFTGTYFQLLSTTQLPCGIGSKAANRDYCIEDSSSTADTFFQAIAQCTARGARLCTISEWSHACSRTPGFLGTVIEAEWVDHAANHTTGAKLVGYGIDGENAVLGLGCNFGGQDQPTVPHRFRCCTNR